MTTSDRTPLKLRRIDTRQDDVEKHLSELRRLLSPQGDIVSEAGRQRTIEVFGEALSPREVVSRVADDVRQRGLEAVLDYSRRIDGMTLTPQSLRVPLEELVESHRAARPELLAAVRRIRDNILEFQHAILHRDRQIDRPGGSYLRQRYVPLERVGICIPGGAAAYPSTVLMTAVPAQAAGVKDLAVVAPPTKFGAYNHDILATCHELGIDEVYRVGGAQAVAMLAYGADNVRQVDKIVGPGNLFVALAKQRVFGQVDIDSIAGPSEVLVLADDSTPAEFAAADLIAQAEHSPGASVLVSWSDRLLDEIEAAVEQQLAHLERADLARASLLAFGALIRVRDADEAVRLTNLLAPEHLHIACENAETLLEGIRHAGAAFLGPYTPVAVGDYAAGPSHVLPTGGTARFAHGLSANDFLRPMSVLHFSEEGLRQLAPDVALLADVEGLTAHRYSVDIRIGAVPCKKS